MVPSSAMLGARPPRSARFSPARGSEFSPAWRFFAFARCSCPTAASAQFVCGGSATGAAPQDAQGATTGGGTGTVCLRHQRQRGRRECQQYQCHSGRCQQHRDRPEQLRIRPRQHSGLGRTTAVGALSVATQTNDTAIGFQTQATGGAATALGEGSHANGSHSVAIGNDGQSSGTDRIAIGTSLSREARRPQGRRDRLQCDRRRRHDTWRRPERRDGDRNLGRCLQRAHDGGRQRRCGFRLPQHGDRHGHQCDW